MKELEFFSTSGGNDQFGVQFGIFLKSKIPICTMIYPFHSCVLTQRTYMSIPRLYMSIYSTFIYNCQKLVIAQVLIENWMNKQLWYKHTQESSSAVKGNKALVHTTVCVNPKIIMLPEKSYTKLYVLYVFIYIKY